MTLETTRIYFSQFGRSQVRRSLAGFVYSVSQGQNQAFSRAVLLSGGPQEESVSKLILVVGRIAPCSWGPVSLPAVTWDPPWLPGASSPVLISGSLHFRTSNSGWNAPHNSLSPLPPILLHHLSLSTSAGKGTSL